MARGSDVRRYSTTARKLNILKRVRSQLRYDSMDLLQFPVCRSFYVDNQIEFLAFVRTVLCSSLEFLSILPTSRKTIS